MTTENATPLDILPFAGHTPGPWRWLGHGIVSGSVMFGDRVLWFPNAVDIETLDILDRSPNETPANYWASMLGACGRHSEPNAHINAALIVSAPLLLAEVVRLRALVSEMKAANPTENA